jgi:hypothetical protein
MTLFVLSIINLPANPRIKYSYFLFYQFFTIQNDALFKTVKVDPGGYGVSWNDEIDLGEYELWMNGKVISTAG